MPVTPDDFREFEIVESVDESVVGIEDGDLVFLSTRAEALADTGAEEQPGHSL